MLRNLDKYHTLTDTHSYTYNGIVFTSVTWTKYNTYTTTTATTATTDNDKKQENAIIKMSYSVPCSALL